MGNVIRYIPYPVVTGFTSGIGILIFSTQIKDFLGLSIEEIPDNFINRISGLINAAHTVNISAVFISVLTIITILSIRKWFEKFPAMLIAMVIGTLITYCFQLDISTINSCFGELPRVLPTPSIPVFDLSKLNSLIMPAFTIAILGSIESLLSATVADGMTGKRHDPDTELIAQGCANIGCAFFNGLPATGAIARTATNIKAGATSPISGIIHALTLVMILFIFAPYAQLIPMASLAGILIIVSVDMSEPKHFIRMFKAPKSDVTVMLVTFLLTVFCDLTIAIQVGIVLAALLFIRRMSEVSNVQVLTNNNFDKSESNDSLTFSKGVEIYEINGPFFFGAVEKFKEIPACISNDTYALILRLKNVPAIDATGLHLLREFVAQCKKDNISVILCEVSTQPLSAIHKLEISHEIQHENIVETMAQALDQAILLKK